MSKVHIVDCPCFPSAVVLLLKLSRLQRSLPTHQLRRHVGRRLGWGRRPRWRLAELGQDLRWNDNGCCRCGRHRESPAAARCRGAPRPRPVDRDQVALHLQEQARRKLADVRRHLARVELRIAPAHNRVGPVQVRDGSPDHQPTVLPHLALLSLLLRVQTRIHWLLGGVRDVDADCQSPKTGRGQHWELAFSTSFGRDVPQPTNSLSYIALSIWRRMYSEPQISTYCLVHYVNEYRNKETATQDS